MATFTYRASGGLTGGYLAQVEDLIPGLVATCAENVPWNHLGTVKNFGSATVGNQVKTIHKKTGIEFKSGFQMIESDGSQKWEGNAVVPPVRLDLQGIEHGWANWAIQIKMKSGGSITVATCLMQVMICFSQRHLVHGLSESAKQNLICELTA